MYLLSISSEVRSNQLQEDDLLAVEHILILSPSTAWSTFVDADTTVILEPLLLALEPN